MMLLMFCKIGVYYGNPEVTSGGLALKFFASVRLEIRPIGKIKSVSAIFVSLLIFYELFNLSKFIYANVCPANVMLF